MIHMQLKFDKAYFPKNTKQEEIVKSIKNIGFSPKLIVDDPNFVYDKHTHPESKILVGVAGSMNITVDGQTILLKPGDRLYIPGMVPHSAMISPYGCTYYWSEKILAK